MLVLLLLALQNPDEAAIKEKQAEVQKFLKTAKIERELRAAVSDLLRLGEQAQKINRYELAVALYGDAEKVARGPLKDPALLQSIQEAGKKAGAIAKEHAKVAKAMTATLKGEATPEDYTATGRFLCFVKGEWEVGLEDLSKGKDEALKRIATDDLAGSDPQGSGDAWAARKEPMARDRAMICYAKAWSQLSGIDREKLRAKLMKLQPPLPPVPKLGPLPQGWRGTQGDRPKSELFSGRSKSGANSIRCTPGISGMVQELFQTNLIPVRPGQRVTFSAWVFSDLTDGNRDLISFQVSDANRLMLNDALSQQTIPADTPIWTRMTYSVVAPATAATAMIIVFMNSKSGFIWLDELSIQVDNIEELKAGSFEP